MTSFSFNWIFSHSTWYKNPRSRQSRSDPLAPDWLIPEKLRTLMEEMTLCESVAVTVALLSGLAANAPQISALPLTLVQRKIENYERSLIPIRSDIWMFSRGTIGLRA